MSSNAWLNDKIMDASQVLICKALGTQDYQSVLNCQKRVKPYRAVTGEYIQLLHNGINHWFLSFCSNSRVQVCDSLNSTLTRTSRKSIQSLYKNVGQKNDSGNVRITFLHVQKKPDGQNCGLFAVAFAAEILAGKSPIEAVFYVAQMRDHLIFCLEQGALTPIRQLRARFNKQKRKTITKNYLLLATFFIIFHIVIELFLYQTTLLNG